MYPRYWERTTKKNKQTWFLFFIFIAPKYNIFSTTFILLLRNVLIHASYVVLNGYIFYLFYLEKIVKKIVVIKHYILQSPYVIFNVRVICLFRKLSSAFVLFFMNYIMVLHISLVIFQITLILYNPFYILVNCIWNWWVCLKKKKRYTFQFLKTIISMTDHGAERWSRRWT